MLLQQAARCGGFSAGAAQAAHLARPAPGLPPRLRVAFASFTGRGYSEFIGFAKQQLKAGLPVIAVTYLKGARPSRVCCAGGAVGLAGMPGRVRSQAGSAS